VRRRSPTASFTARGLAATLLASRVLGDVAVSRLALPAGRWTWSPSASVATGVVSFAFLPEGADAVAALRSEDQTVREFSAPADVIVVSLPQTALVEFGIGEPLPLPRSIPPCWSATNALAFLDEVVAPETKHEPLTPDQQRTLRRLVATLVAALLSESPP
jgi:hypothetical protein